MENRLEQVSFTGGGTVNYKYDPFGPDLPLTSPAGVRRHRKDRPVRAAERHLALQTAGQESSLVHHPHRAPAVAREVGCRVSSCSKAPVALITGGSSGIGLATQKNRDTALLSRGADPNERNSMGKKLRDYLAPDEIAKLGRNI
jgi:hypothetical protein